MALFLALALAATQADGPTTAKAVSGFPTRAAAPAEASVRILSGSRVTLGSTAQPDGLAQRLTGVRLEDGTRRPAKLVEFQ